MSLVSPKEGIPGILSPLSKHHRMAHRLDYPSNFNNKLDSPFHTTIRLSGRFKVGDLVAEFLNKEFKGHVKVIDKRRILLDSLNDWIAGLDTGYDRDKTIKMVKTMYKNKGVDFATTPVYIYLLKRVEAQVGVSIQQAKILA